MVTMLKNVMQLHLHASKTQLMDLGSQYHLVRGEHRLAELFIKICMKNKAIFEQALWEVQQETGPQLVEYKCHCKIKKGPRQH